MTGRVIVPFTNGVTGTAPVPGSKSITNRALLVAALADGHSTLRGALFADDTEAMIDSAAALGAAVTANREANVLTVDGIGGAADGGADGGGEVTVRRVHARASGTTARFCLPVLAALGGRWLLEGDPQLQARPFGELISAVRELGVEVAELDRPGYLPIELSGGLATPAASGPHSVSIGTDVSSQFASGMLLAGPLMGGLELHLEGAEGGVSRPYIDMTVAVMRAFGAEVSQPGPDTYLVGPSRYQAAYYMIEPDASAASYFFAAAALCGGTIRVAGLGRDSTQGDTRFAEILGEMGAEVAVGADEITVGAPPDGVLHGGEFDLRDCSDTAQTLAAVAAFAEGTTRISGIGFIRHKETDRVGDTADELAKRGVDAVAEPDGITVQANPVNLRSGVVDSHEDHRMAMSMSLLGARLTDIEIDDPGCVAKTFPDFFDAFESIRADAPAVSPERPGSGVVAIDGPAASGKSSVARAVAARLGLDHMDTGAMYRAVALAAMRAGVDPDDAEAVARIAAEAQMDIAVSHDAFSVALDGVDVTDAIRTPEVDRSVSAAARIPAVRNVLVERQRRWAAESGGGVMEGRDIGSVVFPDAVLRVFLTATHAERARRRLAQQGGAADAQRVAELTEELARRDRLDSGRAHSPLRVATGSVIIDTSDMSESEVVDQIVSLYEVATSTAAPQPGTDGG